MPETLIEDAKSLQPYLGHLKKLGYRTTDQLAGAAKVSGDSLAAYLGITDANLQALISSVPRRALPAGVAPAPRKKLSLGVRLDRIPRPTRAFMMAPPSAVPLPPLVNLIAEMQPIRDQGDRGTCVAHAATAVAEHYWRLQGQILDLSRQFLYWDCKQHDGDPNEEGTWVGVAMPQLQSDGCCLETTWPYVMTVIPGNESQDPPPTGALAEAATYKIPAFRQLSPTSVLDIKSELAQDRCVAFTIPVFNSWYQNDEVTRTGEIVNPIPNEQNVGGHAMCFVGYEDIPTEADLGGGKFYVRNSWNGNWATEPVLGTVGYGTIPYSYIAQYATEAYSIG
jgi:C1A family cysteine protease